MTSPPGDGPPDCVAPDDVRPFVEQTSDYHWVITYHGAECKFESSSPEDAVLYDLEIPEPVRNRGIGTSMVRVAEQVVREKTDAQVLYAQIGASGGATKHVLSKCGFDVMGVDDRTELGKVVDASKKLP